MSDPKPSEEGGVKHHEGTDAVDEMSGPKPSEEGGVKHHEGTDAVDEMSGPKPSEEGGVKPHEGFGLKKDDHNELRRRLAEAGHVDQQQLLEEYKKRATRFTDILKFPFPTETNSIFTGGFDWNQVVDDM